MDAEAARKHNRLNLGCGEFHKEGFLNVDCYAVTPPDLEHDLESFPYPFEDNQFEWVEADHVLEHLSNPFAVIRELHRSSKPGAEIIIRVPHFSRGFSHPEHKSGFDVTLPYYFRPDFKGGYQGVPLKLKKMRLTWYAQPYLKKDVLPAPVHLAATVAGKLIDFFANISPTLCARGWCFWVGGFEQIEYRFVVEKD